MTVSYKWLNVARRLQGLANNNGGGSGIIEIKILIQEGEPVRWVCDKRTIEPRRASLDGLGDDALDMVVRGL